MGRVFIYIRATSIQVVHVTILLPYCAIMVWTVNCNLTCIL